MAATIATTIALIIATLLALTAPGARAQPVAPGPTPAPLNLTAVLEKGGQYNMLIRLLRGTQVEQQINSQLNNSFNGLTVFAPTDNAFSSLEAGTLNSLNQQQQVALVLYHVLSRYYSLSSFQTTSNPVQTQASGSNGVYTLNITSTTSQVNISTGVVDTLITNTLTSYFPLAVYSVEKVLLPYGLFGAKPPATAPAPAKEKPGKNDNTPTAPKADGPSADVGSSPSSAVGLKGRGAVWSFVAGAGVMGIVGCLL
ncbi:fasciclin-like arabinogalactan protein 9 [Phoenix dactylifera]|uniref:Fasciclin-like arabinogalactan protein 9 n=1 Tax=Phoenix dactylifera TaxID=42345 RepID=A0A8B7CFI1_PHODC|nr:fasciclin-like arabinogalactan protein 9 [Phoenix dactylifera]